MNTSEPNPDPGRPIRGELVRGYEAMMQGRWNDAEAAFASAARTLPDSPVPTILAATLALVRGDRPGAVRLLRSAARSFPNSGLVRAHLAEAYLTSGQAREAERQLGMADALDAGPEVREFCRHLWERARQIAGPA